MAKKPVRYAWALRLRPGDPELRLLSLEGEEGLGYAQRLAWGARERRLAALQAEPPPAPLTVAELAATDFTSPVRIHTLIKRARLELFGKELSDRAIAYRLATRDRRGRRRCAEEGCAKLLPPYATAARRYCTEHSQPAGRVRRHRRRRTASS